VHLYGDVEPKFVSKRKMELINASSALSLSDEPFYFDPRTIEIDGEEQYVPGIAGMGGLKDYLRQVFASRHKKAQPRGLIMVGLAGTGKSAMAKALGNEMGWPTLRLDMSLMVTSSYGGTENAMRQVTSIVDAMSPAVFFIDEAEKAFAGVASSNSTDGGTTARMFGGMLEWLNDHKSRVYTILTCNDVRNFPPALSRAGRFDFKAFVDVPTDEAREQMWEMYLQYYELDENLKRPACKDWTGAEIKDCCNKAALQNCDLLTAAERVQSTVQSDPAGTDALREWARGKCVDTETGRPYGQTAVSVQTVSSTGARRAVTKKGNA
jgi:SpoVK/Ycf46/Vps4 family AAA+-type ATPase